MAGRTFSGTYGQTVVLTNSATENPAKITGTITAAQGDGIDGSGFPWTVINSGTVAATGVGGIFGIYLSAGGSVTNGSPSSTSALTKGNGVGVDINRNAGTVTNFGTIAGLADAGVILLAGGAVTNGSTASTTAQIDGSLLGIDIFGGTGKVVNFGKIQATGAGANGIYLGAGGSVTNGMAQSTSALIEGSFVGIDINRNVGTVTNFGTIAGGNGVVLVAGGTVTNGSAASTAATIDGSTTGIDIFGGAGTVANFGTVQGTGSAIGVALAGGGSVRNGATNSPAALIEGGIFGVLAAGAETVNNFGTIKATGTTTASIAIRLNNGGNVTNGSAKSTAARIQGVTGIDVAGGAGMVSNFAVITSGAVGVDLEAGGSVSNGSATVAAGAVEGGAYGIVIAGAPGRVANFGGIFSGTAISLAAGGNITNGSTANTSAQIYADSIGVAISGGTGSVTNFGSILGPLRGVFRAPVEGVYLQDGGSVANGSASSHPGYIGGYTSIKIAGSPGLVTNFGRIVGVYVSVELDAGGTVANALGALIDTNIGGGQGVLISQSGGTVANLGTIAAGTGNAGYGIELQAGGSVTNGSASVPSGSIVGKYGIRVFQMPGTVVNFGRIGGMVAGVDLLAGGNVTNGSVSSSSAFINGAYGVRIGGSAGTGTVTNFGTISGGVFLQAGGTVVNGGTIMGTGSDPAVQVGSAVTLIIKSGAEFDGAVVGSSGDDTVVFQEGGSVSLVGFVGFETIDLAANIATSLAVTDANFADHQLILTLNGGNHGNTLDASATTAPVALIGGSIADTLIAGSDTTMTGGGGSDMFLFSGAGDNIITDFRHGTDQLVFEDSRFDLGSDEGFGTTTPQPLDPSLFVSNATGAFASTTQRFAFNTTTRELFYSPNGDGGPTNLVATLGGTSIPTAHDLSFIA